MCTYLFYFYKDFSFFIFLQFLGDISEETISSIYMETASLAFRLNKPLSCRLLLMENKKAGDLTDISHPYICNSKVFRV